MEPALNCDSAVKSPYIRVCDNCGASFERRKLDKRTNKLFCCMECYWADRRTLQDINCAACGILFKPTTKGRPFCCRECYDSTRGHSVTKECVGCKKEFEVKASIADRYNHCSKDCRMAHSSSVRKNCETCNKSFLHNIADVNRGVDRRHCSEECRRPPHIYRCECCGKESRKVPCEEKRRYCSTSCYRKSKKSSSLEVAVAKVMDEAGIQYTAEYKVGRYSIDFAIIDQRIAVEADGDYWHNDEKDSKRDAALLAVGWRTVRIKESVFNAEKDKLSMVKRLIDSVIGGTGIELV